MREAVTDELGGAGAAVAPGLSMGKVWAVSERPVSIMVDVAEPAGPRVRGMMVMSRTPSQVELNGNAGGRGGRRGGGGGGGIFGGVRWACVVVLLLDVICNLYVICSLCTVFYGFLRCCRMLLYCWMMTRRPVRRIF